MNWRVLYEEIVNYLEGGQEPNYYWGRIRGAFEDGKTFCQGYGDAYEFLCHRAGLYCLCINGNGHKWSGIRLNNELYHMDTTWMDAGEGDYYEAYSHPFTSDEEGHEPHMKDFHAWSHLYPEWGDMVLNTGSIPHLLSNNLLGAAIALLLMFHTAEIHIFTSQIKRIPPEKSSLFSR